MATDRRVEVMDGEISATPANQAALRQALEAAGVEFFDNTAHSIVESEANLGFGLPANHA